MARKSKRHLEVQRQIEALGVYKPEFDEMIDMYVQLRDQYVLLYKRFADDGYRHEIHTVTGVKKAPLVMVLETLRKDILTFAAALGLTPQGLRKINEAAFDTKTESKLEAVLAEMGDLGRT